MATSPLPVSSLWAASSSPDRRKLTSSSTPGTIALDPKGKAEVALPKGAADAHGEFAYQLTSIGGPASLSLSKAASSKLREARPRAACPGRPRVCPRASPSAAKITNDEIGVRDSQKHREQMKAYEKLVESNKRQAKRAT
jgi:hypothetical protein